MDGEAFVPVRYTASAEVLERWELTLQALGVPYELVDLEETDGWSVRVPEPLAEKVREALRSAEADERAEQIEEADEDNMEEIDEENIMGRRTRGRNIDFAQAAKNLEEDDEDEEDDDDFVDEDADKMEE